MCGLLCPRLTRDNGSVPKSRQSGQWDRIGILDGRHLDGSVPDYVVDRRMSAVARSPSECSRFRCDSHCQLCLDFGDGPLSRR